MKKKLDVTFDEGKLILGVDSNQDGEKVVNVTINLNEGYQEILKRGEKIEGVKLVDFDFSLSKLKLKLDTDQDGEEVLDLVIDLAELLDEVGIA